LDAIKERYRFKKEERLGSEKAITQLFAEGKRLRYGCLQFVYAVHSDLVSPPLQVMISVPKKKFKRAVLRNLIKRRIREAWRLNKKYLLDILSKENKKLRVALVFISDEVLEYTKIEESIVQGIKRLAGKVEKA
jgi:ribonuclease P protein component